MDTVMNDQLRRRIKTKAKHGVPRHLIAIDISSITGQRMAEGEIERIIEEPIADTKPGGPADFRRSERRNRIRRTKELKRRGYELSEISEILGISRTTAWRYAKEEIQNG